MRLSECGAAFITLEEGFRPWVYDDFDSSKPYVEGTPVRGTLTIGYGETDRAILAAYRGKTISREEALRLFRTRVDSIYAPPVDRLRASQGWPLSQQKFDALVSFTFNLGSGVIRDTSSSLRRALDGDWAQVPAALNLYVKSKGQTLPGLVRRRKAEGRLFAHHDYGFKCDPTRRRREDGDD